MNKYMIYFTYVCVYSIYIYIYMPLPRPTPAWLKALGARRRQPFEVPGAGCLKFTVLRVWGLGLMGPRG